MPIFILVRTLVLLVCIESALIMSFPARTINKTLLNHCYWIDYICPDRDNNDDWSIYRHIDNFKKKT